MTQKWSWADSATAKLCDPCSGPIGKSARTDFHLKPWQCGKENKFDKNCEMFGDSFNAEKWQYKHLQKINQRSTIYLASASIREETSFEFPGLRHPPIPLSRAGSNQGTLEKLATGIAKHGRVAHTNDFGHVSGRRFSRFGWASMGCTLTKKRWKGEGRRWISENSAG